MAALNEVEKEYCCKGKRESTGCTCINGSVFVETPSKPKDMSLLTKQAAQLPEKITDTDESRMYGHNQAIDDCTTALPNVNKVLIEEIKEWVRSRHIEINDDYDGGYSHAQDDLLTYLDTLTKDV